MNLTRWRTFALWLIAALVTMASLAAFAQSYRGLYDWAREHGLSGFWAGAWPVQLDVFIAVGELALFVALVDKWPRRARIGAWTVTLIGAAVSVAGNVGHVAGHDIASRLTAAVPPVAAASALFVALTILKWVTRPADRVTVVTPVTKPQVSDVTEREPVTVAEELNAMAAKVTARKPSKAREARIAKVRRLLEQSPPLTVPQIAARTDVHPRTVARYKAALNGSVNHD